nr:MAG TPA: FeoB-associated Cys-rich membrane protein [Caudoviricetes sp.]
MTCNCILASIGILIMLIIIAIIGWYLRKI